jgi:hypothetical protein
MLTIGLLALPFSTTTRPSETGVCTFLLLLRRKKKMYRVVCEDQEVEVENLQAAMDVAKVLDCFVSIFGEGMEIVGRFGADSIKDGVCPDGVEYTWRKRR